VLVLDGEHAATRLAFTPDGARLVAVAGSRPPEVWALATGERLRLPDSLSGPSFAGPNSSLAVHPSGRVAFLAHGPLSAISLPDGSARAVAAAGVASAVIVSPDGGWVVTAGRVNGQFRAVGFRCSAEGVLEDTRSWEVGQHMGNEELGGFVGTGDRFVTVGPYLVIRDTATGEVKETVRYTSHHYRGCAASPDGTRFAVMGYDKLYLWDTATWGDPTRVPGLNRWVRAMAFHPTRPILLAVQNLQTLAKYLDADTGRPIRKFQWKLGVLHSVAFSPDGALAAAGSAGGKIVVWDVDE
jgi:WD40 repeat protein